MNGCEKVRDVNSENQIGEIEKLNQRCEKLEKENEVLKNSFEMAFLFLGKLNQKCKKLEKENKNLDKSIEIINGLFFYQMEELEKAQKRSQEKIEKVENDLKELDDYVYNGNICSCV